MPQIYIILQVKFILTLLCPFLQTTYFPNGGLFLHSLEKTAQSQSAITGSLPSLLLVNGRLLATTVYQQHRALSDPVCRWEGNRYQSVSLISTIQMSMQSYPSRDPMKSLQSQITQ